jgi:hypothetical protein
MSHKATTWLASLPAGSLSNAEFRVLFHLCDCHNASGGCFPAQAYLLENTAVSNGTLNNALNGLEARGLIRRHRTHDAATFKRRPTHYTLGFEMDGDQGVDEVAEPSPVSGDGNGVKKRARHLQSTGVGAISKKTAKPSPKNGQSHLQPTGDKPVIEPVRNRAAQKNTGSQGVDLTATAMKWKAKIEAGSGVPASVLNPAMIEALQAVGVADAQLRALGATV